MGVSDFKPPTEADWYLRYAPTRDQKAFEEVAEKHRKSAPKRHRAKVQTATATRAADIAEHLSVKQVAELLKVDQSYVYQLIRKKSLVCQPLGKRRLVSVADLQNFLNEAKNEYYGKLGT